MHMLKSKLALQCATIISLTLALLSLVPILIHLIEREPEAIKPTNAIGFVMWSAIAAMSWRKWRAIAAGER